MCFSKRRCGSGLSSRAWTRLVYALHTCKRMPSKFRYRFRSCTPQTHPREGLAFKRSSGASSKAFFRMCGVRSLTRPERPAPAGSWSQALSVATSFIILHDVLWCASVRCCDGQIGPALALPCFVVHSHAPPRFLRVQLPCCSAILQTTTHLLHESFCALLTRRMSSKMRRIGSRLRIKIALPRASSVCVQ